MMILSLSLSLSRSLSICGKHAAIFFVVIICLCSMFMCCICIYVYVFLNFIYISSLFEASFFLNIVPLLSCGYVCIFVATISASCYIHKCIMYTRSNIHTIQYTYIRNFREWRCAIFCQVSFMLAFSVRSFAISPFHS